MDRRPRRAAGAGLDPGASAPAGPDGPARDLALAASAVAHRFAAGATLLSVAPAWPANARHIAVEFVHPVVVGTRALPAVHVEAPDILDAVRTGRACHIDVLVAVAAADDGTVSTLMPYACAWGLLTVWLEQAPPGPSPAPPITCCGRRRTRSRRCPAGVSSSSTTCCGSSPRSASSTSGPGRPAPPLLRPPPVSRARTRGAWGRVVAVGPGNRASVRTAAGVEDVDVTLVEPRLGGLVLVHAGTAVAVVGETSA